MSKMKSTKKGNSFSKGKASALSFLLAGTIIMGGTAAVHAAPQGSETKPLDTSSVNRSADKSVVKQINTVTNIIGGSYTDLTKTSDKSTQIWENLINGKYVAGLDLKDNHLPDKSSHMISSINTGLHNQKVQKYVKFKSLGENKTEISVRFNSASIIFDGFSGERLGYENVALIDGDKKIFPVKKHMVDDSYYEVNDIYGNNSIMKKIPSIDNATYIVEKSIDDIKSLKFEFEFVSSPTVENIFPGVKSYEDGKGLLDSIDDIMPAIEKNVKVRQLCQLIMEEAQKNNSLPDEEIYKNAYTAFTKLDFTDEINKTLSKFKEGFNNGINNGFLKYDNKLHEVIEFGIDPSWSADNEIFNKPEKIKDVVVDITTYSGNLDTYSDDLPDHVKEQHNDEVSELENDMEFSMANGNTGQGGCFKKAGAIIKRGDKYFLRLASDNHFNAAGLHGQIFNIVDIEDMFAPSLGLGSVLANKRSYDAHEHLKEINADGYKVHRAYDGYLNDDFEIELSPLKRSINDKDPINYSPDCKRWAQTIQVCVEAMGYSYTPQCFIYISDIDNYEGFNYRNSMVLDNYRKNLYKFLNLSKLDDRRADICKKQTEDFTSDSMINVLKSSNLETYKLFKNYYPTQSWAETLELMKKSKAEIKNTLVKKDGSPVTDEDISFLNFNNEKVDNLPDTVDYTAIDADMAHSTSAGAYEMYLGIAGLPDSGKKGSDYSLSPSLTYAKVKDEDKVYTWSVENNKSANTKINSDGLLTIGEDESSDSIRVKLVNEKLRLESSADVKVTDKTVTPAIPENDLKAYDESARISPVSIFKDVDAVYEVPVEIRQHTDEKVMSMANEALANNHKMIITEKNGERNAYLVFDKRVVSGGVEGRLTKLFGFKDNQIGKKFANDILCDMVSYKEGANLGNTSDMRLFPHVFRLPFTDFKEGENTVYLRVNVDAMDGIKEGSSPQICHLKFDLNNKTEVPKSDLAEKARSINNPCLFKLSTKNMEASVSAANTNENSQLDVGISYNDGNEALKAMAAKLKDKKELDGRKISRLIYMSSPEGTELGSAPRITCQINNTGLKSPVLYLAGDDGSLAEIDNVRTVGPTTFFTLDRPGTVVVTSEGVKKTDVGIASQPDKPWSAASTDPFTFIYNADISTLNSVKVDGKTLKEGDYTAESGSVKITLKKEFLSTLSEGPHTLEVAFNESENQKAAVIKSEFTVAKTHNDKPGTDPGDKPGTDPGDKPGTDPGDKPGTDPGDKPGTDPGDKPGTVPGDKPGTDPGDKPEVKPDDSKMPGDVPSDNLPIARKSNNTLDSNKVVKTGDKKEAVTLSVLAAICGGIVLAGTLFKRLKRKH